MEVSCIERTDDSKTLIRICCFMEEYFARLKEETDDEQTVAAHMAWYERAFRLCASWSYDSDRIVAMKAVKDEFLTQQQWAYLHLMTLQRILAQVRSSKHAKRLASICRPFTWGFHQEDLNVVDRRGECGRCGKPIFLDHPGAVGRLACAHCRLELTNGADAGLAMVLSPFSIPNEIMEMVLRHLARPADVGMYYRYKQHASQHEQRD
eukprot:TRINITY_DN338_c0_g1_i1.p1 TRINITY_DN338_c0_g1~~TRINITY_DN338_c0_g1_i1.p1  ORF type:complete len:208 (+),score=27.33 TRINITY_DN338_c0_g1_i1:136-759(+)